MPAHHDKIQTFNVEAKAKYLDGLKGATPITYDQFTEEVPVTTGTVEFPMVLDISGMREFIGERHFDGFEDINYTVKVKKFEKTIEIPIEALEDDNLGLYRNRFKALGEKARIWPDQQVYGLLKAGETAKCYDGQPFFSESHPIDKVKSGVFSNLTTGGGTPWYMLDVSQVTKPMLWLDRVKPQFADRTKLTDDPAFERDMFQWGVRARAVAAFGLPHLAHKSKATLDDTNFNSVLTAMQSRVNHVGENLGVGQGKVLLVVPPALRATAKALVELRTLAAGGENPNYGAATVIVAPRLV